MGTEFPFGQCPVCGGPKPRKHQETCSLECRSERCKQKYDAEKEKEVQKDQDVIFRNRFLLNPSLFNRGYL